MRLINGRGVKLLRLRSTQKNTVSLLINSGCFFLYGGRSAVGLTRQIVALKIGSSNLLVHPINIGRCGMNTDAVAGRNGGART